MKPKLSYTIWSTQRTGSTLLCKALESTGIAGKPNEWLNHAGDAGLVAQYGVADHAAAFLVQHPRVTRVNYPSLPDHPQQTLAKRQMPKGFGGMFSFVVDGGREGAVKVIETCQMISIVPSFGTSRTIATHPATHTHDSMTPQERKAAGIYDGLIRLSVGLEAPEDIIRDLEQALEVL